VIQIELVSSMHTQAFC